MRLALLIFSCFLFTTQVRSETIYVLSAVYVSQFDLSRYEKKWYSSTSITSDGTYYFASMDGCRRALKDKFIEETADSELEVASNKVNADYPGFTLTFNSGGSFYHYECVPTVAK